MFAQLPSMLQPKLDQCLDAVTSVAIRDEFACAFGLDSERASAILQAVFKVVSNAVSAGQINEVRGQLPEEMRHLLPSLGLDQRRQRQSSAIAASVGISNAMTA